MKSISTISALRNELKDARSSGSRIGFVPTMGALHEGHLSLVRLSQQQCDRTVVSIFVNPTQFAPDEDFTKYPRTLENDETLLRAEDVDFLFVPEPTEIYSPDYSATIDLGTIATVFEGEIRPGHFNGVAGIVAQLFNIVQPDTAIFGQKDLQQAAVIKKLVRDLKFPVEIVIGPIVRDHDGLALSSRNRYLSELEREEALVLYRTLKWVRDEAGRGLPPADALLSGRKFFDEIAETALLDYLAIVDPETFQILDSFKSKRNAGIVIAGRVGGTRLIDNILISS